MSLYWYYERNSVQRSILYGMWPVWQQVEIALLCYVRTMYSRKNYIHMLVKIIRTLRSKREAGNDTRGGSIGRVNTDSSRHQSIRTRGSHRPHAARRTYGPYLLWKLVARDWYDCLCTRAWARRGHLCGISFMDTTVTARSLFWLTRPQKVDRHVTGLRVSKQTERGTAF